MLDLFFSLWVLPRLLFTRRFINPNVGWVGWFNNPFFKPPEGYYRQTKSSYLWKSQAREALEQMTSESGAYHPDMAIKGIKVDWNPPR